MAVTATIGSRTLQRVRLHIDNPAPSVAITGVIRTDISGTQEVRVESTKFPNSAVSFDVYDYEYSFIASAGVPISYAVYAGSAIVATATVTPSPVSRGVVYLTVPMHPSLGFQMAGSTTFKRVTTHTERRDSASTLHRVVGRPDPIPVLRGMNRAEGTFEVNCESLHSAQDLIALLARADVFQLRQSDQLTLDQYFIVRGTDMSHGDLTLRDPITGRPERRWLVAVEFSRVSRPAGNVSTTAGWSYEDLISYGTYAALQGPFPTYADLLTGP